jgi:predicted permease
MTLSEEQQAMRRFLNLFGSRRRRMESDLDRELRYHMERRVRDLTDSGLGESEARRQAAIEFGGIAQVQEEVRDAWFSRWLDDCGRDVRYAVRTLLRSPGFTATSVLSLALGIGASAAVFSLFDQALLRLLPVKEPERLVLLDWKGSFLGGGWGSGNLMSYPLCRDLQEQKQFFDGVFCRHPAEVMLSTGQQPRPVGAEIVSGTYFPVLGVRPELGRLIDESDNLQPGAHPVIVLSYDYWKNNLGGVPDIVGRKVLVNNHPMTVIGVAAAGFRGMDIGEVPALWIPAMMKRQATPYWDQLMNRRVRWMHAFGRLKPGISAQQAKTGLQPWFKSMLEADTRREGFPQVTAEQRRNFLGSTIDVVPAAQGRSDFRREMDQPLWVLMMGTLLLLLLASVNVANLLLARGVARAREVTTRFALGASRARVTSQLVIDGLLIALAGGLLGLFTAPFVSKVLISFLPQDIAGVDLSARMDHRVFLLAFLASTVAGCLCGLAPALQLGRLSLISSLKDRSAIAAGGSIRLRRLLVVCQMAFTLILLVGAGLFVRTLAQLYTKGPGFATSNLLMFSVSPLRTGYNAANARQVIRDLLPKLHQTPGVESAAVASHDLLAGGSWGETLTIDLNGRTVTDRSVQGMWVSPGFFSTLGTHIIMGRDFNPREPEAPGTEAGSRSVIVNERFAKRYFGNRSPIGYRIGLGNRPNTTTNIEIVGVVRDFNYLNLREEYEHVFFPFRESAGGTFYVRARGKPESAFASMRAAVAQIDPALPLLSLRTIDDQMDRSLMTERILASLSSGFAAIALLLSVVGLYGVISFIAAHRTQEIGIRMALGATRRSAVWLITREALIMIGSGVAIALPCVWALSRFVEAQLFGVRAVDGPTIAGASVLLVLVALGSAMLPAWRAASVSPTRALHYE